MRAAAEEWGIPSNVCGLRGMQGTSVVGVEGVIAEALAVIVLSTLAALDAYHYPDENGYGTNYAKCDCGCYTTLADHCLFFLRRRLLRS